MFFVSIIYTSRRVVVFATFFSAYGRFVFYFVVAVASLAERYLVVFFIGLLCEAGVFFDVGTLAKLIKLPKLFARGIDLFFITA